MSEHRMVSVAGTYGSVTIPWSIHLEAWGKYAKKWGGSQTAERLAERGGFHASGLDDFVPDWRERTSEIAELKAQCKMLEQENVELKRIIAEGQEAIDPSSLVLIMRMGNRLSMRILSRAELGRPSTGRQGLVQHVSVELLQILTQLEESNASC